MITHDLVRSGKLKRALKRAATTLIGPYRFNRIYRLDLVPVEPNMLAGMSFLRFEGWCPAAAQISAPLRERFEYGGEDAYGYGLLLKDRCIAVCWFWGLRRFNDPLLWRLKMNEAMLVDLVIDPPHRGEGLASLLIGYAAADMHRRGFQRLYTWMWHNHRASFRAFEKAGWNQVAWVLEIRLLRIVPPLRLCWRRFLRCKTVPAANGRAKA